MNIDYSDEVMDAFYSVQHVYVQDEAFNLMGHAGDTTIGEYVHLYFHVQKSQNYIDSKIIKARFSAMGSVLLIAAAEQLCILVEQLTFQEALKYCDPDAGLHAILKSPKEKVYSVNFVTQAFYNALETLTIS